jgi:peptidyl-prolyl cis-trans isomerase B (cyclophilin B)
MLLFIGIIGIFIGIVVITQTNSSDEKAKPVSKLPPEADIFKQITPSIPQQQRQQQQVQGQKTQQVAPTFGVEAEMKASYSALIKTSKGDITITLDGKNAPKTVRNFLDKAKSDYYKNLKFHRVEDWVVQGGDPKGDGTGGNLIGPMESTSTPFVVGSLGVAGVSGENGQTMANDSQFFIVKTEASWLNQKYTNFGNVTSGIDIVNSMKVGDKILGITIQDAP